MKTIALAVATLAVAAAPNAHAAGNSPTTGQDQAYIRSSIEGDRFEVDGGRIALRISHNTKVRALAKRLIKDHRKSLSEAEHMARRLGIEIPRSPSTPEQWELRMVGRESGTRFDIDYADLEVADHKQDIEEATHEWTHGGNLSVRLAARKELPTLRKHLQMSRRVLRSF
ncbi:MAG: putative rane protein [Pseudonocardiales bacterium]|jgi:putative membrane protein|nr:putative rane protein [Pseudonocardiales bacterium]